MKSKNIAAVVAAIILLFILTSWLLGCSTIHKVFHKEKSRIDSTSVTHEKKDSVAENNIIAIHKDSSRDDNEIVFDFGDRKMVVTPNDSSVNDDGIYVFPKNPDDYFSFNQKTGEIKTNVIPKKVVVKGSSQFANYDSLADHSHISLSDLKEEKTQVKSIQKQVEKEKKKTTFQWWWFLLIIPAYLIYRNRKGIWAFAVHTFTGL